MLYLSRLNNNSGRESRLTAWQDKVGRMRLVVNVVVENGELGDYVS